MAVSNGAGGAGGAVGDVPWFKDRFALGSGAAILGLGGALSAAGMDYYGSKASARAMAANANSTRREAVANREAGVSGELSQRVNQNRAMGAARVAQAVSGFTDQGSGMQREVDMASQYEHAIAQSAARRENAYRSALDQADVMDWQARQARKAGRNGLAGSILGSVAQSGFSVANLL